MAAEALKALEWPGVEPDRNSARPLFRAFKQNPPGTPKHTYTAVRCKPNSARSPESIHRPFHRRPTPRDGAKSCSPHSNSRHSNYRSSDRGTDCRRSGASEAVQEPFPDATWRGRESDSEFFGNQRCHRLPHPVLAPIEPRSQLARTG